LAFVETRSTWDTLSMAGCGPKITQSSHLDIKKQHTATKRQTCNPKRKCWGAIPKGRQADSLFSTYVPVPDIQIQIQLQLLWDSIHVEHEHIKNENVKKFRTWLKKQSAEWKIQSEIQKHPKDTHNAEATCGS